MTIALRYLLWLALPVAAVSLSACGGDLRGATATALPSNPSVSQPAGTADILNPARAGYVRQVDSVCARYNPQREHAGATAGGMTTPTAEAEAYGVGISLAEQQLSSIEAIAPPRTDRTLIQQNVVDRLRTRIALRRSLQGDLLTSNAAAAQRDRAQLDALTIALQSFARGYGFRVCGAH